MMLNLGLSPDSTIFDAPFRITFSVQSSSGARRRLDFLEHQRAVRNRFQQVDVESHVLSSLSARDQAAIAAKSNILVSVCGGGVATATFLPRGSSLILFYEESEEPSRHRERLDWDLLNHAYFSTHWIKIGEGSTEVLMLLIEQILSHQAES